MNPTNRCTRADVEAWIKPIMLKEGLKDYTLTVSGSSEKGDGYLGDITFVNVSGSKEFNFVVKCGKKSDNLREMLPVRNAFENEIYFYDEVLPTFDKFQKEKRVERPFDNTPKCYGTLMLDRMEVLVLENMKHKEFNVNNRRYPLTREHIDIVIATYAKLHAISFAMRDQKPQLFKDLTGKLQDVLTLMSEKAKDTISTTEPENMYKQIISIAERENESVIIEKCNFLFEKMLKKIERSDPEDPFAVILHGDCWNNNFMFKHNDEELKTSPEAVCFLDFQLSKLGSPVHDLSYFLFTCLSKEDVQDFDEINRFYYQKLSNNIREMGSDPEKVFPFAELQNQWKKFGVFGLSMLPSLINICLSDKDEVPDLVQAAEDGTGIGEMFNRPTRNVDEYRDRTIPIMKLAIEKGFV